MNDRLKRALETLVGRMKAWIGEVESIIHDHNKTEDTKPAEEERREA